MKHFIITGTSTGIGLDLVENLLTKGHIVWACLRNPSRHQQLLEKYPNHLRLRELDITHGDQILSIAKELEAKLNPNDEIFLINNAGIAVGGPFETLPIEAWRETFEVNVFGVIQMTKSLLPIIRKHKGRIINIGSISGRLATPYLGPYTSSKFALRSLTDSLRREMLPRGVKVVLIEPGPIQTPIWDKSMKKSLQLEAGISAEQKREYQKSIDALNRGVVKTAAEAIPVSSVTEIVLKACFDEAPKPYYLVGRSAKLRDLMNKILPTSLMDKIMERGFRGVD